MNLLQVKGIGDTTVQKLNQVGIFSVEDLVYSFPKSYVDMDGANPLKECQNGDLCVFPAIVKEINPVIKKGKLTILRISAGSDEKLVEIVFFNQPYFAKTLHVGEIYRFYGKVRIENGLYFFTNPQVDLFSGEKFIGIQPVYKTKGLIAQRTYASFVKNALELLPLQSVIKPEFEKKFGLVPFENAVRELHNPKKTDLDNEKKRILFEKIVKRICAFRLAMTLTRKENGREYTEVDFSPFLKKIPFELSHSQTAAIDTMTKRLLDKEPLNAILCGDVGSGKTIVAVALSYFVIKNGYKVAFMAPTSILARQHYTFIDSLFSSLGLRVLLLTGSSSVGEKKNIYDIVEDGKYDIIVGTHSLLNDKLKMSDLGLVVTDEQHRFGVAQRTRVITKGNNVGVLTMSATPIPRSMRLVAYGEVEFLTIERRRASTVKTRIVTPAKRNDLWRYVSSVCEQGEQAYVVCPSIFDCEGVESDSVEKVYEEIKNFFPPNAVAMLHGKMKSDEKQSILDSFYKNKISVLVSTTVIEVGIDVANATIMVICDVERFGLATLHQLRGRIGRGDKDGYCFLYTEKDASEGLKTLVECNNGFEIAEKDFSLRGGGEIFGLEQSGGSSFVGLTFPLLKKASLLADDIDIGGIEHLLHEEIKQFSLDNVSLN